MRFARADLAVGGAVVEIAGDQAGQEKVAAGDGGVWQGPAQRIEVSQQVGALVDADGRCALQVGEAEADGDGDRQGDHHVAGNGGQLAAADGGDDIDQAFEIGAAVELEIAEQAGQRLRRHGRLLGGDGHAQQVDQYEAEAVNHAVQEGFAEQRGAERGGLDLEQGHQADENPGAAGRQPHPAIVAVRLADVVFAGAGGVFRDPDGEQAGQLGQVEAQAVAPVLGKVTGAARRCRVAARFARRRRNARSAGRRCRSVPP